MSNNSYLLNTPTRVSDIASLRGRWLIVAEARYCIPLPWLCMFADADLRPCTITFNHSKLVDGEQKQLLGKFSLLNPSTSVKAATNNLARARHIFEALAGDAETGAKHWREAMASLENLPLEYLTIDPTEILLMDHLKAGATEFASAISFSEKSLEAKRRIAGLEVNTDAERNFAGLTGGFLSPAWFEKRERSLEEARSKLELLAKLDICNLARTANGYETLPLDLNELNPPDSFWENTELLEKGARHITVTHGECTIKDGKKHYATSLANVSNKRVRVGMFGGFASFQGAYVLANYTKAWFTAKDFTDWYGVSKDGWIRPGETVTDYNNWGGNDDGFWAYWCESEDKERFIAFAWNPKLSPAESTERSPADPWEPVLDSHRAAIVTNTEICQNVARDYSKREVAFDLNGVQWLDDLLEELHGREESRDGHGLIPVFGAFLGECIIRNIGGEWAIYNGDICVRFDDNNAAFPLNKVRKQLANGKEGGDSVVGFHDALAAMRPKPLTDRQQRFLALYQERSDCQYFVLSKTGEMPEWAKVKKIEGLWVAIETELASGLRTKPAISVRLDQISGFYITDSNGELVDSEGFTGAPAAPVPAATISREHQRQQAASIPGDATMENAINRLRSSFSDSQKFLNARAFESLSAPCPSWIKPSLPLHDIFKHQFHLLTEGSIVWAALVQANNLLFSPGAVDCPALLVHSRDPHFDSRPHELRAIGRKLGKLKNTSPADPAEKVVADLITGETDLSMGWKVPSTLTDKEVYGAAFMVFRKHIPNGVLSAGCFPILVHPSTQAVMIVPFEFWPIELIILWKEGRL